MSTTAQDSQHTGYPDLDLLTAFAERFLKPSDLGYVVNNYTRDQARVALGLRPVESTYTKEQP